MDCEGAKTEAFPCTDDVFNKKSDASIKSHLQDLAKKHPEFAGDLKCPPWGGSHTVDKSWENARTIPVSVETNEATASNSHCQPTNEQPQRQNEPSQSTTCQQSSESHSKENPNPVDSAEQPNKPNQKADNEQERLPSASAETSDVDAQQRAVSHAQETNKPEPKRFMSKVEITPINPYELPSSAARVEQQQQQQQQQQRQGNEDNVVQTNIKQIPVAPTGVPMADPGSPQMGRLINNGGPPREIPVVMEQTHQQPQQQQNRAYMSPQSTRKQPQVRHIPIFVEGRPDPVVTNPVPVEFEQKQNVPDLTAAAAAAAPLKRKLDNGNVTQAQSTNGPSKQNQSPGPLQPPNQSTQQENASEVSPPHASERPVTPTPPKVLDPMERIQQVQEEVNALTAQVERFRASSRSDKEYLYLDEMLTRNLIKLDTIEVEGNDKLRSARKDVIKSIQRSISMLESKVPSLNTEEQPNETIKQDGTEHQKAEQTAAAANDAMEIDTSNTCTQPKTPHKVDGKDKKAEKKK